MSLISKAIGAKRRVEGIGVELILRFVESILPRSYVVQQVPDFVTEMDYFRDFQKALQFYNHHGFIKRGYRDPNRVLLAHLLLRYAAQIPEGDYAELGTYQGNFARILYNHLPQNASLYCFDTFEGFHEADVSAERTATGIKTTTASFSDTSINMVRQNISGNEDSRLVLVKGAFPDTYAGHESKRWRFVHIDCDLYAPARSGLEIFWPSLVPGGVILCHDYNHGFVGIKKAVDEFFGPLQVVPVPFCDKAGSCVVIKPLAWASCVRPASDSLNTFCR